MTLREEIVAKNLKNIAKSVERKLPDHFGFVLLAFEFNDKGELLYVSNANREDVVKCMEEFIVKTKNNYGNIERRTQ